MCRGVLHRRHVRARDHHVVAPVVDLHDSLVVVPCSLSGRLDLVDVLVVDQRRATDVDDLLAILALVVDHDEVLRPARRRSCHRYGLARALYRALTLLTLRSKVLRLSKSDLLG